MNKIKNIAIIALMLLIGLTFTNLTTFANEDAEVMMISEETETDIEAWNMTVPEDEQTNTEIQPRTMPGSKDEITDETSEEATIFNEPFVVTPDGEVINDDDTLYEPTFLEQYGIDILALVISLGTLAFVVYDVNKDKFKKIKEENIEEVSENIEE